MALFRFHQDVGLGVGYFYSDSTFHQTAATGIGELDSDSTSVDGLVLERRAACVQYDGRVVFAVSVVADMRAFRAALSDV